jgi:hypothetical protein
MNRATHINVMTIGVIFGIAGMTHGFGEILQGNTPTGGVFINAIGAGSSWSRWTEGGEAAFTLIPNFLLTGIFAVSVGLAIVIWSLGFVHKEQGPFVFLLLFVLLFLVGGGIGQVLFFIPAWTVAREINKPLTSWRRLFPVRLRRFLAHLWPWLLGAAALLISVALIIAVFGYLPGVTDMDRVLNITLSMVGAALIGFLLAFVAGFARDIEPSGARMGGPIAV